jgi:hypothetical protein
MRKWIVGVVSENANNDGLAIADLLDRYFPEIAEYKQLLEDFKGSKLGNEEFLGLLFEVFDEKDCDFLIVLKDLDKDDNLKKCIETLENCNKEVNGEAVCMLFEYMIERLAIVDFKTTCKKYDKDPKKTNINHNLSHQKKALSAVMPYKESDICDLVKKFDLNVLKTYSDWAVFIAEIEKRFDALWEREYHF